MIANTNKKLLPGQAIRLKGRLHGWESVTGEMSLNITSEGHEVCLQVKVPSEIALQLLAEELDILIMPKSFRKGK